MNIEKESLKKELLGIKEKLLEAEKNRIEGSKIYTLEEVDKRIKEAIKAKRS